MRYFIEIAYNGKNYHGWQRQPNAISIQEVLERTLSTLLREDISLTGAGRTDTGVHAKQLFAHFDLVSGEMPGDIVFRLNSFLPNDIAVRDLFAVKVDAHARFHATEREYEYRIGLTKNPFNQDFVYTIHIEPDLEKMNDAAKLLLGHQDFQCFSRSNTDVKTYYCDVKTAYWTREKEELIFRISADRFLRNMVRAVVGTLLDVGSDKTSIAQFKSILSSRDRSEAGPSAPAHGLYLTKITYPKSIQP